MQCTNSKAFCRMNVVFDRIHVNAFFSLPGAPKNCRRGDQGDRLPDGGQGGGGGPGGLLGGAAAAAAASEPAPRLLRLLPALQPHRQPGPGGQEAGRPQHQRAHAGQ